MLKINHLSHKLRRGTIYVLAALGGFIVIANTVASQQMPGLFFTFIEGGRESVVAYLAHIKTLPLFREEMVRYKNEFGTDIENDVFRTDVERQKRIHTMLDELKKQPRSRDLLYALSSLYREDGNEKLASYYLGKAKELDPSIQH